MGEFTAVLQGKGLVGIGLFLTQQLWNGGPSGGVLKVELRHNLIFQKQICLGADSK